MKQAEDTRVEFSNEARTDRCYLECVWGGGGGGGG